MKPKKLTRFVWALLMLFLTIVACTGTSKPTPTAVPTSAPATTPLHHLDHQHRIKVLHRLICHPSHLIKLTM